MYLQSGWFYWIPELGRNYSPRDLRMVMGFGAKIWGFGTISQETILTKRSSHIETNKFSQ